MTTVHPPLNPELAPGLALLRELFPPSVTPEVIEALRSGQAAGTAPTAQMLRDRFEVSERTVPGPTDAPPISVLIVRPRQMATRLPGLVHLHGGGMIIGNNLVGMDTVADWMVAVPMVVVSVEYRLAPEHPHPAPVEDCYAGLLWTAEHLDELGIDPERLLVGGASAGGGLAAAVALMARDRGGPRLAGQLLQCPMLDDRAITPSSGELTGEGLWDSISNATGWQALLGGHAGGPDVSAYAAPARAVDLSGLPPTFIDVGSMETFRDEDVDYAVRIWRAGGQAELHVWPGGFHGFDIFAPDAPMSRAARAARIDWLGRLLATP
jgi:acetyl esterase/lipase